MTDIYIIYYIKERYVCLYVCMSGYRREQRRRYGSVERTLATAGISKEFCRSFRRRRADGSEAVDVISR